MRLGRIAAMARQLVEKRGGTESLKGDAAELREIAKGEGTLKDKAKAAGEALKKPGQAEPEPRAAEPGPETPARPGAQGTEPPAQSPPGSPGQSA